MTWPWVVSAAQSLISWAASRRSVGRILLDYGITAGKPILQRDAYVPQANAYQASVSLYAAIDLILAAATTCRIKIKAGGSDLDTHWFLDVWNHPAPGIGRDQWIREALGYLLLTGNSYLLRIPKRDGSIELMPLRPDRVWIVPSERGTIESYRYGIGTAAGMQGVTLATHEVIHCKTWNPANDWYGLSPVKVLSGIIDTEEQSITWNRNLLLNNGRPSGAIVSAANLTQQQYDQMRDQLIAIYQGPKNAGRPMVLEGGVSWVPMGIDPVDMDWLKGRQDYRAEIARAYHVPEEMLGISEATYENRYEAMHSLYMEAVIPKLRLLISALHVGLGLEPDLAVEIDLSDVPALQEDEAKRWARIDASQDLTINEKRAAKGYGPLEGGDRLLLPAFAVTLDQLDRAGPAAPGPGADPATDAARVWTDTWHTEGPAPAHSWGDPWAALRRPMEQLDAVMRSVLRTWYIDQGQAVAGVLSRDWRRLRWLSGPQAAERLIHPARVAESLLAVLRPLLADGEQAGRRVAAVEADRTADRARLYGQAAASVPHTMRHDLAAALPDTLRDATAADVISRITTAYRGMAERRSPVVARTESAAAYNFGRWEHFHAEGVRTVTWVTAGDERVRHTHQQQDGATRTLGQPFPNGCRYPHDPLAPASETINCRCLLVPTGAP